MPDALRINLGSGRDLRPRPWINVDLERYRDARYNGVDFRQTDAVEFLRSLPDGSAAEILACQFLEHFRHDDGLQLLRECRRVISPAGQLRISVPDFAAHIADYIERKQRVPLRQCGAIAGIHRPEVNLLLNILYHWGHQCVYDEEMLTTVLQDAGWRVERLTRPDRANLLAVAVPA